MVFKKGWNRHTGQQPGSATPPIAVPQAVSIEARDPLLDSYEQAGDSFGYEAGMEPSNAIVTSEASDNLIQWQLEMDSILERVEHMLRGDKIDYSRGSAVWVKAKNNEEKVFTDAGVAEIMRTLSIYLNRNTILSNYDAQTIDQKMFDFGKEISNLIFLKYEVFFSTMSKADCAQKLFKTRSPKKLTERQRLVVICEFRRQLDNKRKLYPSIVRQITDAVHSAYLRALHGGERESLRESRTVTQTEALHQGGLMGMGAGLERRSSSPIKKWIFGK